MNKISIIAIIAAVMLVGVTIQHQALASSGGDTFVRALSTICGHTGKSLNPHCNNWPTGTHDFLALPTP
jgi:hypothetical protein